MKTGHGHISKFCFHFAFKYAYVYMWSTLRVQVDPKPERASVDFGFKIIFFIFRRLRPFWLNCFFLCRFCTRMHVHVRVCMRTCTHLFSCNKAYTCTVNACPHIYMYIYIYIYTHNIHTKTHACIMMMHACTDLCFSLTHMHAHRLPHPDMLHSRGIKALCGALPHQATAQSL